MEFGLVGMPIPVWRIGIDNAESKVRSSAWSLSTRSSIRRPPPTAPRLPPVEGGDPTSAFADRAVADGGKDLRGAADGSAGPDPIVLRPYPGGGRAHAHRRRWFPRSANALFQDNLPVQRDARLRPRANTPIRSAAPTRDGSLAARAGTDPHQDELAGQCRKITAAERNNVQPHTQGLRGGCGVDGGQPLPHKEGAVLPVLSL